MNPSKTAIQRALSPLLAAALSLALPIHACTIFVLTDGTRTLFFNNEDYSNPATRLWFAPAGPGYLGAAYLGFDDGWAQGGLNTAGLAYDWVAGFTADWDRRPEMQPVRGNPAQRMIESCRTVEEAIQFFETHWEPSFARARMLVADATGASAIIGAHRGRLQIDRANTSRGFGYGQQTLARMLRPSTEPALESGLPILRACAQKGANATKYSNVFDLRSGTIHLYPATDSSDGVTLRLEEELARGGHYYDLPNLRSQRNEPPRPLRPEMIRFYLDGFPAIEDREPRFAKQIERALRDASAGTMREQDYAPEFWRALAPQKAAIQADFKRLGDFRSLKLVQRRQKGDSQEDLYKIEFANFTVLQRFTVDPDARIQSIQPEASEPAPGYTPNREK